MRWNCLAPKMNVLACKIRALTISSNGRRPLMISLLLLSAMLTIGSSVGECYPKEGLNRIGTINGSTLLLGEYTTGRDGGSIEKTYLSGDGGLTWEPAHNRDWGSLPTDAPSKFAGTDQGHWELRGTEIVQIVGDQVQETHRVDYLQDRANQVLHHRANPGLDIDRTTEPYAIAYHYPSGNLVAAMGWDGALVIASDGTRSRIAVGEYIPTDFSVSARLRLMLTQVDFWVSALMVAISFTALGIILPRCGRRDLRLGLLSILATVAGIVALVLLAIFALEAAVDASILGVIAVLFLAPAAAIALLLLWPADSNRRTGMALGVTLLLTLGAVLIFPAFGGRDPYSAAYQEIFGTSLLALAAIPAILVVIVAAFPYRPPGTPGLSPLLLASVLLLSIAFLTLLWMLYIIPGWVAKWASLALATGTSLAMLGYLRGWPWRNQLIGRLEYQSLDTEAEE